MRITEQPYRPWHDDHVQLLERSREERGLHHALLLQGPRAMGKRHFALRLSRFLLCLNPAEELSGCGVCASCGLLDSATHPDLHHVIPEKGKQIGIDQIRQLRDRLVQTPQVGDSKVCLIEPADALNENSASALLKLLEEPPESTCFLLVVDNPNSILPTIKSRCFSLPFYLPSAQKLKNYLLELEGNAELVDTAMRLSRGFPEKAIDLVDRKNSDSPGASADNILEAVTEMLESWFAGRCLSEPRIFELSKLSLESLLDALIEAVNQRLTEGMHTQIDAARLIAGYRYLIEARRTVPRNPNTRLLLQSLNIDIASNLANLD